MIKESTYHADDAVFREVVPAGDYWMQVVKAGQTFRILDLEGNQAADTLFYNANDPSERYSAFDTIREQGNVYLTAGTQLLSNEGNVLLEITADTCGRHDTLGGACSTSPIPCAMPWKSAACMPVGIAGCWPLISTRNLI